MCNQHETRLQPLLASMSVAHALETAMAFELSAARFYRSLAGKVRRPLRPLLEELAAEEAEHHRLLEELSRNPALAARLSEQIEAPPSREDFAAYIHLPELPADPLDDDLLAYAQDRERIACEHYAHLAELAPAGPLRNLFGFLRNEEKRHEDRISARWAAMFSIL